MKKILFLILFSSPFCFAQTSVNDNLPVNIESTDSTFYKSGQVQVVTCKIQHSELFLPGDRKLVKIFYQYDECGNLRNVTHQYKIYVKPELKGISNPSSIHQEHHLTENKICEKDWKQPLFLY